MTISPYKMRVENSYWSSYGSLTSQSYNGEELGTFFLYFIGKEMVLENVHRISCLSHICLLE